MMLCNCIPCRLKSAFQTFFLGKILDILKISFQAQAESFLQIIVQLFFMILLVLLGAGTVVAGVGSAQSFFDKVCKFTLMSINGIKIG